MAAKRRLAVIMFTDTVGYSASSQTDESGTLRRLREQEELVRPLVKEYQGREIKSTGDGFLVEFDSALKAAQCAVEIQRRMHERNSQQSVTPIQLRIGIHLGDVEEHGDDIFGDAVNIAARVEPMADPGGVCVSGPVFDQVHHKIPNALEKLPPANLKNLRFPVDIYRVALPWLVPEPASPGSGPTRLAVLPFVNFSPDPNDGYFADGLTEELITLLSQLHEIRVIARTSVFQYKSTPKSVAQIGAELGVGTVLEGSVRKAGNQVRITVQLIDVGSQEHTWADTYDRRLDDVFAIQTEVAKRVAEVLKIKMGKAEERRIQERPAVHPDSYLAYLKGRSLLAAGWSEEGFQGAKAQFELAIEIDPSNARAHSGLADAVTYLAWGRYNSMPWNWYRTSRAQVQRALQLDPDLAEAHNSLATILWDDWDWAGAERELKAAISANPSSAESHHTYGSFLMDLGRHEDALHEFVLAEESDPNSILILGEYVGYLIALRRLGEAQIKLDKLRQLTGESRHYLMGLGYIHFASSEFPQAVEATDRLYAISPEPALFQRVFIYAVARESEKARKAIEEREHLPKEIPLSELAMLRGVMGDLDECFRLLEKAWEQHTIGLQLLRSEPALERVRNDPRFGQLLKKMNLA